MSQPYPKLPHLTEKICEAVEDENVSRANVLKMLTILEQLQDTLEEMGEHGQRAAEDVCVLHGSVCCRV